jgi:hypothetical protein
LDKNQLVEWDTLDTTTTGDTIEQLMLKEIRKIYNEDPKKGIHTKYFKDNYQTIFGRTSTNPQPRINKAMRALRDNELAEIKKVHGKNYIRALPITNVSEKPKK